MELPESDAEHFWCVAFESQPVLFRDVTAFEPPLPRKKPQKKTHWLTKSNFDSIVTMVCPEFSMQGE